MAGSTRASASPEAAQRLAQAALGGDADLAPAMAGLAGRHGDLGFLLGCAILAFLLVVALFADAIAPHDPYAQSLVRRLRPPAWSAEGSSVYPLGTDAFGRDYLSRLIHGTRISLAVGAGAAIIAGLIGSALGVLGGYCGGLVDRVVSYAISTRLALPSLLIALAILQVAGSGLGIVILVLGLTNWDRFAVVMRTVTRQVRRQDYVTRARTMGASDWRIVTRDVFPNVFSHFVVIFTFEMAQCILAAAVLSVLGLGIQAPEPSWGLMMAEGRNWLTTSPWLITNAGLALMLLVLAVNLVGDGLRNRLTPQSRA
jgi:peptide/nickel transport system permease protein